MAEMVGLAGVRSESKAFLLIKLKEGAFVNNFYYYM